MDSDYIKTMSYEEKIIFLKVFCALVRADGVIDNDEIDFLKMISARYGLDNATVVNIIKDTNNINAAKEAAKITNRKLALQLIKEMCVLANIDENLQNNELDIIIDTAMAMRIEDDKIVLINRYVLDSLILSKAGKIILEESNE